MGAWLAGEVARKLVADLAMLASFDSEYAKHRGCDALVVVAGAMRTGSTAQYNWALNVLQHAVPAHSLKSVSYFNSAFVAANSAGFAQALDDDLKRMRSVGLGDVVLAKHHEFDARLVGMCRRTIVVTTAAWDPASVAASACELGWHTHAQQPRACRIHGITGAQCLAQVIYGNGREHRRWTTYATRSGGTLFLQYKEELLRDPLASFEALERFLRLQLLREPPGRARATPINPKEIAKEQNKIFPSSRGARAECALDGTLVVGALAAAHAMANAEHGLTWAADVDEIADVTAYAQRHHLTLSQR